jgi:hypothetical protein
MSKKLAILRIATGAALVALLYAGPFAYGLATADGRVDACLSAPAQAHDVVVKLSYVPGPTQIEELQRYGRYGGSGGDPHDVVLLGVPASNLTMLSRLYWVDEVEALDGC